MRHPLGDETIPRFLGGRTPADSLDLYRRISPVYQADRIKTPLLLVIGDKDETRYDENLRFYEALQKSGSPARLVVSKGEGHGIASAEAGVKHVRQSIDFFRASPPPAKCGCFNRADDVARSIFSADCGVNMWIPWRSPRDCRYTTYVAEGRAATFPRSAFCMDDGFRVDSVR